MSVVLLAGCADDSVRRDVAADDEPITAPVTARGLTAGLLRHLDTGQVTSYGGEHSGPTAGVESWSALAQLDGELRTVFISASLGPGGLDEGCEPEAPFYTEESCSTTATGAKRSVMRRASHNEKMPILSGRTTRADGTSFLVEVFADEASDEAKTLVLDLLNDEALGARTTVELNAAGEELDDYQEMTTEVSVETPMR